jgi:hypothetical protein
MKIFFALLVIITLVFGGYHLTFRQFRIPLIARTFYLSGLEFILLGVLLGPMFFSVLDEDSIKGLEPLMALLLGWVGMLVGFQFEISMLRRFPVIQFLAAIGEGLVTLIFVFVGVYMTLGLFPEIPENMKVIYSLSLASAAACTAQTGLALVASTNYTVNKDSLNLICYISSIGGAGALVAYGFVFLFRPETSASVSFLHRLGIEAKMTIAACFSLLLLYSLFLTKWRRSEELNLIIIGMAVISSGMASLLNLSPILLNFFMGLCLVNLSLEKERIFNLLISVEKPVYLMILVFLGAHLKLYSTWPLILGLSYIFFRSLGKFSGWFLVLILKPDSKKHNPKLGFALIDQGGLPLAILLDFLLGFRGEFTKIVISVAIVGIIFNDIVGIYFQKRLFVADSNE